MLPSNNFAQPGYVHNRKGFSVTRFGNRDVAYVLNVKDSDTGTQLAIETLVSDNNGPFREQTVITPVIPYRIQIGDSKVISVLERARSFDSQKYGGNYLLFNPGVTINSNGILEGIPALSYSSGHNYIELNVDRAQIGLINFAFKEGCAPFLLQKCTSTFATVALVASSLKYTVNDTQASLVVKNNNTTDDLYISVTTTISMSITTSGGVLFPSNIFKVSDTNAQEAWSWSIPVLIKLSVNRNSLPSGNVRPASWRYLFPLNQWAVASADEHPWEVSRINEFEGSEDFFAKSWNYNLIPLKKHTRTFIFWPTKITVSYIVHVPVSRGCVSDTVLDLENSRLFSMSAVGNYEKSGTWSQRINWMTYSLSSFNSVFYGETAGSNFGSFSSKQQVTHLYGVAITNRVLFSVSTITTDTYGEKDQSTKVQTALYYYNTSGGAATVKLLVIAGFGSAFINKFGATFSMVGIIPTDSSTYIYSLPSTTVMDTWGCYSITAGTMGANLFVSLGKFSNTVYPIKIGLSYFGNNMSLPWVPWNILGEDKSLFKSNTSIAHLTDARISSTILDSNIEVYHSQDKVFKVFNISDTAGVLNATAFGLPSINDYNVFANEYFRVRAVPLTSNVNRIEVQRYKTSKMDFSVGTPQVEYWTGDSFEKEPGLKIILKISSCAGLYRSGDGTKADWNHAIALNQMGVLLNSTYTRPDLSFVYFGDYSAFESSYFTQGYGVSLAAPTFELTLTYGSYGNIAKKTGQLLTFTNYTVTGEFVTNVLTCLDLEGVLDAFSREYTDPNYILSNVIYTLKINTADPLIATGTVTVQPPSPIGAIDASVYKTVTNAVGFSMTRDTNTTIRNIMLNVNDVPTLALPDYVTTAALSANIPVNVRNYPTGSALSIRYKPLLHDSRGPQTALSSRYITNVYGHRYHIDNVNILIDSVDRTAEIAASAGPFVYINSLGSAQIDVSVDIEHDDFDFEAYPSNLERVYPVIASSYLMVVSPFNYEEGRYIKIPPVDAPLTYPNHSDGFYTILKARYNAASIKDSNTHGGSTISTTATFTVTVTDSGSYQLYLLVDDEFDHGSAWCLTNRNNFRIPFRRT